jgi:hypothetical protein
LGKFDFRNVYGVGFIKLATQSIEYNSLAGIEINARTGCRYGTIDTSGGIMNIAFNLKVMAGETVLRVSH